MKKKQKVKGLRGEISENEQKEFVLIAPSQTEGGGGMEVCNFRK